MRYFRKVYSFSEHQLMLIVVSCQFFMISTMMTMSPASHHGPVLDLLLAACVARVAVTVHVSVDSAAPALEVQLPPVPLLLPVTGSLSSITVLRSSLRSLTVPSRVSHTCPRHGGGVVRGRGQHSEAGGQQQPHTGTGQLHHGEAEAAWSLEVTMVTVRMVSA